MRLLTSLDPAIMAVFALNVLFQITAICLIALLAVRLAFRHDPSLRYYVCLVCLVSLLLSPLVVSLQQSRGYGFVTVSLPRNLSPSPAPTTSAPPASSATGTKTDPGIAPAAQTWLPSTVRVLLAAWTMGMMMGSVHLLRGRKEILRLTGKLRPWNTSPHAATLERVQRILNRPVPPIFTSPGLTSPVMIGILRPMVILPEGAPEALEPAQLQQILLHECAHAAFHHTCGGLVERVVRLLYWPHPMAHALCRELGRAREEICDNVASQEYGAACYARTLLALAQGMSAAPNIASTLALLGPGTSLEARIAGLLDPRRNRMIRVKRWKLWAVTCAATLMLASTAVVRVVSAQEPAGSNAAGSNAVEAPDMEKVIAINQAKAQAQKAAAEAAVLQAIAARDQAIAQQKAAARQQGIALKQAISQQKVAARQQALVLKQQATIDLNVRKALVEAMAQQAHAAQHQKAAIAASKKSQEAVRQQLMEAIQQRQANQQLAQENALLIQKAKAEADATQAKASVGHRAIPLAGASAAELLAAKKQAEAEANRH